jgi:hypothetical protein
MRHVVLMIVCQVNVTDTTRNSPFLDTLVPLNTCFCLGVVPCLGNYVSYFASPFLDFSFRFRLPKVGAFFPSWDVESQRSLFSPGVIPLRVESVPVVHGWLLEDQEVVRVLLSFLLRVV